MPELTDEELGIPEGLDPNIRAELRRGREREREATEANARAAQAERRAAFAEAGVPTNPLNAKLAEGYTGENDPASVKAYFQDLGVDLAGKGEPAVEADLSDERQVAQVGSQSAQPGDVRFEDAIGSAGSTDEVMELIRSAPEGATSYINGRERRIGIPEIE